MDYHKPSVIWCVSGEKEGASKWTARQLQLNIIQNNKGGLSASKIIFYFSYNAKTYNATIATKEEK